MTQEPAEVSVPILQRRFNPVIALKGGHRPSRVLLHGMTYLIGLPVVVFVLFFSGAIHGTIRFLRQVGLGPSVVAMLPILLAVAYLALWIWFLRSLFTCARNAETLWGMEVARAASRYLAIATATVIIVIAASSIVR